VALIDDIWKDSVSFANSKYNEEKAFADQYKKENTAFAAAALRDKLISQADYNSEINRINSIYSMMLNDANAHKSAAINDANATRQEQIKSDNQVTAAINQERQQALINAIVPPPAPAPAPTPAPSPAPAQTSGIRAGSSVMESVPSGAPALAQTVAPTYSPFRLPPSVGEGVVGPSFQTPIPQVPQPAQPGGYGSVFDPQEQFQYLMGPANPYIQDQPPVSLPPQSLTGQPLPPAGQVPSSSPAATYDPYMTAYLNLLQSSNPAQPVEDPRFPLPVTRFM